MQDHPPNHPPDHPPADFSYSYTSQLTLVILYTLTTILAVTGNCLAILVFTRGRRSCSELKPFLLNLALADLVMAIFCIPFTFAYELAGEWLAPPAMCPLVWACQQVSVTVSVSTNTAIGIDRLLAVKFPLRRRGNSSHRTKLVVLAIWVVALSLGVVPLTKAKAMEVRGALKCEEDWADIHASLAWGVVMIIVTYFLPASILAATYISIGHHLWNRNLPGNADSNRDALQLRSKKKV